jgi:hypothetical protein
MKLILRTHCSNEYTDVGDYIVVPLSLETVETISKRIEACKEMHKLDNELNQLIFWDNDIRLMTSSEHLEKTLGAKFSELELEGKLVVADDFEINEEDEERADLGQVMITRFNKDYSICWTVNLKHTITDFTTDCIEFAFLKEKGHHNP